MKTLLLLAAVGAITVIGSAQDFSPFEFLVCINGLGADEDCSSCTEQCKAEMCQLGSAECQEACQESGDKACRCYERGFVGDDCATPSTEDKTSPMGSFSGLLVGKDAVPPGGLEGARKKRGASGLFDPKFIWNQDVNNDKKGDKRRKCCISTKRVVPFVWKAADHVYPVYCPLAGGYQWIDQVRCDVTAGNHGAFGVLFPSKRRCKFQCQRACTDRVYLVTNLPPYGYWGHCFYYFVPTWFARVQVHTHCYCPEVHPSKIPDDQKCYDDLQGDDDSSASGPN